jgi:hypothetical protein
MAQFNNYIHENVITSNVVLHYVSVSSYNVPVSLNTCCIYINFQLPVLYSSEFIQHALNKSLKSVLNATSRASKLSANTAIKFVHSNSRFLLHNIYSLPLNQ